MAIVPAKCIAPCMESRNCIQYQPNDVFNIITDESERQRLQDVNLADKYQRRLVWLDTLRGKWIIEFDRANCSHPELRIWFCTECGEPFERLNDIGTHNNSVHNKTKAVIAAAKQAAAEDDEPETADEPIVTERRGKVAGTPHKCRTCGQVETSLYALAQHYKIHKQSEPVVAQTQAGA